MKKLLYLFIALGALYFILALFGPSEIKVERHVYLEQSKPTLKSKLLDFTYFHNNWSPWTEKDTTMSAQYQGNQGQIGYTYNWSGNKDVGSGRIIITGISEDTIYQKLSYDNKGDVKSYFILRDSAQGCVVSWGMVFPIPFLGRTPMMFVDIDKRIGKDYERGLERLKATLLKEQEAPEFDIKELQWEARTYAGRKENIGLEEMNGYFENNFGLLELVLEKEKVKPLSSPSGLVFTYDEVNQRADVSCAFRIPEGTKIKDWEMFTFPACKVLSVEYKGFPSGSGDAHKAIDQYMRLKGYQFQMVIEEYLKGPDENQECYECVTMIYYLLK